jgi:hypothetical protein
MEKQSFNKPISETLGSISSFSSAIYVITLTLSICYNIGYLKQINSQIIDLMELGDYIDASIHNIWFFLLGALIFFTSSLAFVKVREFNKTLIFGAFAFIVSSCFFLKGIYYSKFWPMVKQIIESSTTFSVLLSIVIVISIIGIFTYSIFTKIIKENKSVFSAGVMPILAFILLVMMPYIGGMIHGYIENKYLNKNNYDVVHSVNILIVPGNEILRDVYIIKKLNKGLIIRQFKENGLEDKFKFINWNNIKSITYKKVGELLSPI